MVLLPPGTEATVEAGTERIESQGNSLIIVPPGQSRVVVRKAGMVARVFSKCAPKISPPRP